MTNEAPELQFLDYARSSLSDIIPLTSFDDALDTIKLFIDWKSNVAQEKQGRLPILELESGLSYIDMYIKTITDENDTQLTNILAKAVRPLDGEWNWYDDGMSKQISERYNAEREFMKTVPVILVVAIRLIEELQNKNVAFEKYSELIWSLACYEVDDTFPWSIYDSPDICERLKLLVGKYITTESLEELLHNIRPFFKSSSQHSSVSSAGRKLFYTTPKSTTDYTFLNPSDPHSWRHTHQSVLSLLKLYLSHTDTKHVESNWSFLLPCTLNIIDDHNPGLKLVAADLTLLLVTHTAEGFLRRTGVDTVLWSALQPSLAFLPPSTPESIALPLSQHTYQALMHIAGCSAHPERLYEEYLQTGLLGGLTHVLSRPKPMQMFFELLTDFLGTRLKSYAVPHTKPLVAVVVGTLCDPLMAFSDAQLVTSAILLGVEIVRVCWPRAPCYRYDFARSLVTVANRDEIGTDPTVVSAGQLLVKCLKTANKINLETNEKIIGVEKFDEELIELSKKYPSFEKFLK